ncbi:MAG: hypothetical protein ACE367_11240 [Acidimicrobiales bacterium]
MVTIGNDAEPDPPPARAGRLVTSAAVAAALVTVLVYLFVRLQGVVGGAFLPLGIPLLAAESVLLVAAVATLLPALALRRDGAVVQPRSVPYVDTVIVLRDERLLDLRMALRSCRELRGLDGLVVVGGDGRRGVDAACRAFGVPHLRQDQLHGFGIETTRRAHFLLVVPANAWVSPDAAVMLAGALGEDGVAAATGTTAVHGVIDLLGSEGYLFDIDAHTDLALRLDAVRSAPPLDGPVLFSKDALRSVGGVDWQAPQPALASHVALTAAGRASRSLDAPVAYRMAPADEAHALAGRVRRSLAWRAALAAVGSAAPALAGPESGATAPGSAPRPGSRWRAYARRLAALEPWAAPARLVALLTPLAVSATGRSPVGTEAPLPLVVAALAMLGALALARRCTDTSSVARFGRIRSGVRTLGADLAALRGTPSIGDQGTAAVDRARRLQFAVLGTLLVSVIVSTLLLTRGAVAGDDLPLGVRLVVAAAIVAVAALVRDASTAYRQQRLLPRVHYQARHDGDLTDLSPTGYTIASPAVPGEERVLELDLPYPGERMHTVCLPGVVRASRTRGSRSQAYVEIDTDHDTFEQLIYFCAVTAPTIAWLGGTARAVCRDAPARARLATSDV